MGRHWFALALVFAVQPTTTAYAQKSAEELLSDCTVKVRHMDVEKLVKQSMCVAYVSGAVDMLVATSGAWNPGLFCFSEQGHSNEQLIRVVVKWIEKNPEEMHESARLAILSAIVAAFPCKGKRETTEPPPK